MARKRIKKQKPIQIIVGEGFAEKAFILYVRSIYSNGNVSVKVKSAGGKGPKNVIMDAIGEFNSARGDIRVAALLDTDLEWPKTETKKAVSKGIVLLGSTPCLEGLLLDILEIAHPIPPSAKNYKKKAHGYLTGPETDKDSYCKHFGKEVLEKARLKIKELDTLILLMC